MRNDLASTGLASFEVPESPSPVSNLAMLFRRRVCFTGLTMQASTPERLHSSLSIGCPMDVSKMILTSANKRSSLIDRDNDRPSTSGIWQSRITT